MVEGYTQPGLDPVPPLVDLPEWRAFEQAARGADRHAGTLRVLEAAGLQLDLSAQAQSPELVQAGLDLLKARDFEACRARLLEGGIANCTENRPAWHTALRAVEPPAAVAADVLRERERERAFVHELNVEGRYRYVLHIGIGGSDWGPRLAVGALGYAGTRRRIRFVSNIDGHAMVSGLLDWNPRETLVVVSSKSFATTETLHNAQRAIEWLRAGGIKHPWSQVVAITARPEAAQAMGALPEQTFSLWDWAGGRYSIWSSIGLPIALALGMQTLDELRQGAAAMDAHFAGAPLERNMPVHLALAGIVNRNVLGYPSANIAPYDARLANLVPYLQQLEMESLGKGVDLQGRPVSVATGPVVWGMPGTDGQHTFFQWLHQGPEGAPVDFIVCREADHPFEDHHRLLLAHCLAQREALLRGKTALESQAETAAKESDPQRAAWLGQHKMSPGGRPSNLIVLPHLDALTLGSLLALYEHKVFVQGVVWGIDPFDQWGVEFGKVLAAGIARELAADEPATGHDVSTSYWVEQLRSD